MLVKCSVLVEEDEESSSCPFYDRLCIYVISSLRDLSKAIAS